MLLEARPDYSVTAPFTPRSMPTGPSTQRTGEPDPARNSRPPRCGSCRAAAARAPGRQRLLPPQPRQSPSSPPPGRARTPPRRRRRPASPVAAATSSSSMPRSAASVGDPRRVRPGPRLGQLLVQLGDPAPVGRQRLPVDQLADTAVGNGHTGLPATAATSSSAGTSTPAVRAAIQVAESLPLWQRHRTIRAADGPHPCPADETAPTDQPACGTATGGPADVTAHQPAVATTRWHPSAGSPPRAPAAHWSASSAAPSAAHATAGSRPPRRRR